jgi:Zn-dependent protease
MTGDSYRSDDLWGPPPPPAPEEPRHEPIHPRGGLSDLLKRIGAPLAALGLLLVKVGTKLKLVLLALSKVKLFSTFGTALVSVGAYALLWPWQFAVLFVLLLLVHEYGHVLALRREGIPASAPMFVPFLGALVAMKAMPRNALAEARVGLAGPVLGTLAALGVWALGAELDSDLLRAAAYTGFLLNLFNLAPITPLDGGRAAAALHPAMWLAGLGALVGLLLWHPNPILFLILLVGAWDAWRRWKARQAGDEEARRYYEVSTADRLAVAAVYFGLAAVLVVGLQGSFVHT